MKKITLFIGIVIPIGIMSLVPTDFLESQLGFSRVKNAYSSKKNSITSLFSKANVSDETFDLYLRAFKTEKKLEVFVKNQSDSKFTKLTEYDFCATSGVLGPKRKSGDKQIPEGFYKVIGFNPQSQYHLSFKINYPNESDLAFADKLNPGSDIFIHGDCATIGCIPIGNDKIDELYLIAAMAKNGGGKMDVHIFPKKLSDDALRSLTNEYGTALGGFWKSLQPAYLNFEATKQIPVVSTDSRGNYIVK